MKLLVKYIFIVCLIMAASCEKPNPVDCEDYDFADCYLDEPEWDFIYIDVTINDENPYVPIILYNGEFEDKDTNWVDTAYSSQYSIDVDLNHYYSVTAEYKVGSKTIIAVDGNKVKKVKTTVCDEKCWYIKGENFNVELKFD